MLGLTVQIILLAVIVFTAINIGINQTIAAIAALCAALAAFFGSQYFKPMHIGSIKNLIASSNVPMYYMDSESKVIQTNDAFCALLGIGPNEIIKMNARDLILHSAAKNVVENERDAFIKEQLKFIKDVEERGVKNLETTVTFSSYGDNSMQKVWIHADVLYRLGMRVGSFVMFHRLN